MPRLLFADGLGQYVNRDDLGRRFVTIPNATGTSLTSYTRTSGATAKETNGHFYAFSAAYPGLGVALNPSTPTEGALMCRVCWTSLATTGWLFVVKEFDGTAHLTARANADGSLSLFRGHPGSPTLLATSAAGVVSIGPRYAIELKWAIHDSTGTVGLRVNEVEVVTFSGDTRNGGAASWRLVDFCCDTNSMTHATGDIHVADATGGLDYLGDLQTDHHMPTGAGNSSAWTPSTGANHQCVDDVPHNSDTDYVSATAVGTRDTYAYQNLVNAGAEIVGVTVLLVAKKIDAGVARLATVTRHGGADYVAATEVAPSGGDYRYLDCGLMEANPGTTLPWVEADFNAAEFGEEKTA